MVIELGDNLTNIDSFNRRYSHSMWDLPIC